MCERFTLSVTGIPECVAETCTLIICSGVLEGWNVTPCVCIHLGYCTSRSVCSSVCACVCVCVCVAGLSTAEGRLGDNLVTSQPESSLLSLSDSRAVRHSSQAEPERERERERGREKERMGQRGREGGREGGRMERSQSACKTPRIS